MFEIIKNVIGSGRYELSSLLTKIDVLWVRGDITDEQKEELVSLAQSKADVSQSMSVKDKLLELDLRVKALESTAEAGQAEYPDYVVGRWYYGGDKVTFDTLRYLCIAPSGTVCTWSPAEYPAYWKKVS